VQGSFSSNNTIPPYPTVWVVLVRAVRRLQAQQANDMPCAGTASRAASAPARPISTGSNSSCGMTRLKRPAARTLLLQVEPIRTFPAHQGPRHRRLVELLSEEALRAFPAPEARRDLTALAPLNHRDVETGEGVLTRAECFLFQDVCHVFAITRSSTAS